MNEAGPSTAASSRASSQKSKTSLRLTTARSTSFTRAAERPARRLSPRIERLPQRTPVTGDAPAAAPGVRTRFDAAGHVLLDAPDGTVVDLGPRGYATLSLFARPVALGEAIERLQREAPATDFAPTMNVVNMLIEEGALVRCGVGAGVSSGWADPVEHARMLHDDRRTGDYLAAIGQAVRPGDVVLDIGTGSGVLAIAATRAGGAARLRGRGQRHRRGRRARIRSQRCDRHGHPRPRLVAPDRTARAGRLAGRGAHRQRAARGGDPRDDARCASPPTEARRATDPAHADAAGAAASHPGRWRRGNASIGRAAVERWRRLYGMEFQPLVDAARPVPGNMPDRGRGCGQLAARGSSGLRSRRST